MLAGNFPVAFCNSSDCPAVARLPSLISPPSPSCCPTGEFYCRKVIVTVRSFKVLSLQFFGTFQSGLGGGMPQSAAFLNFPELDSFKLGGELEALW